MALALALSNSIVNYTSLNLTDASGVYNVSTNPTGWGAPNTAISAILFAELEITLPGNTTSTVFIDIPTDLGIDFATATYADLVYNIPYHLLNSTTTDSLLVDGVYTVKYKLSTNAITTETWVDGAAGNYYVTATIMTYYEVQESVYARIALLPSYYTCSGCDNKFVKETSTIFMLLQSLIASTQYSNTVRFTEILTTLTDILSFDSSNCTSCGC